MAKIRAIVVDDHPFVIEGIKISLLGIEDIEIIGDASDSGELYTILQEPFPDILLLDIIALIKNFPFFKKWNRVFIQ